MKISKVTRLISVAIQIFLCVRRIESIPSDFCIDKPLYNRHAECNKYVICYGAVISHVLTCAYPLEWDHDRQMCNWKEHTKCVPEPLTTAVALTKRPTKGTYYLARRVCTSQRCKLPNCKCPGTAIPGGLLNPYVPQIVLLTMEDSINEFNYQLYMEILEGRNNPNGCPVKATFFISGKGNDFNLTYKLYQKGHEIGVHSLTHQISQQYWKHANYSQLISEIIGMKNQLENHGIRNVVGYRSPFLQHAGDHTLAVLKDHGFLYDSSIQTKEEQLWWPYTFEYKIPMKDCVVKPCPKKSFPGLWEVPVVPLKDSLEHCTTYDSCYRYNQSVDGVFQFLVDNFNRHYRHHKSPFPLFGHATWMTSHFNGKHRKEGLLKFLDDLKERPDVYIVSIKQAIEWVKNPTKVRNLNTLQSWKC